MPCKVHTGPRGGKFTMKRKKGGGTKRVYRRKK